MSGAHVDLLGIGEAMLLLEPSAGERLATAATLAVRVAGAELNACAAVAALGGSSALLTRLGDDPLSDRIVAGARELGVAVLGERARRQQAGVFFKQHETGDRRSVYYYRSTSAASTMDAALLRLTAGLRAQALLVSGLTAALGPGPERLILAAAEAGLSPRLVVDANLRPQLGHQERSRAAIRRLLPRTWLLSLGTDEGKAVFGTARPDEIAAEALRRGCDEVVIKDGEDGSFWVDESGEPHHVPPVPVQAVDTVGAGDAFTGSYVWGRLNGYDREASTVLASRVAARVVATRGDTEGLPSAGERDLLLAGLVRSDDAA